MNVGKFTRKQFLKGGAIGAAAIAAMPLTGGRASADDEDGGGDVFIHFHGVLSRDFGGTTGILNLPISVDVAGRKGNLAGAGWDSGTTAGPTGMVPTGVAGACYYTAAGRLDKHVVLLEGRSLFTNAAEDTRADGRRMFADANLKTGRIRWTLVPAATTTRPTSDAAYFTGTGVVIED